MYTVNYFNFKTNWENTQLIFRIKNNQYIHPDENEILKNKH